MRVLLVGASGFIGRHITRALVDAGHTVSPVSRRDGTDVSRMLQASDWLARVSDADAVVNALGIIAETGGQTFRVLHTEAPVALFRACVESGGRRVVQISAIGADSQARSAYHLSKRAADRMLLGSGLDATVLYPSLVHGPGSDSTRMLMRAARLPVIPALGGGTYPVQPVYVGDLAEAVVRCVAAPAAPPPMDAVGPEAFGMDEWLRRLRAAQGLRPAPMLRVPFELALAGSFFGQLITPLARADNLRMLQRGSTGDVRAFTQLLGREPLAPTPDLIARSTPPPPERRAA